ncbi:rhomboid family protein [Formosa agariphila KMM 3901]|uniref:Rhomboid family protein n=1 Tax=Formosa agariphila (strain DSM 15362 / KCTC 12365 / LMG 23005 / KMM 3901 / M-2Alg 35-1) TaxID=1347342 RepID=T2KNF9_FORAG|nr:rhomboid family intramembrane serine protease [Formosa agariphila]CDF79971.1 rhomboid family protein [Formosa agariphila KMM 3901]
MSTLNNDIKQKLAHLNVLEKIIAVNVIIFFVGFILQALTSTLPSHSSLKWFELSSHLSEVLVTPWTFITYAFIHYDFIHMLFNMLWLYFIGKWFLNMFSKKLTINIYFLGAISGAVVFLLGYNLLPNVFHSGSRLVGASAAVRALLIFMCAYMPQMDLRFFTFNIKLWIVGAAMVAMDVLGLFGTNAGGNLAHIGGAALGFFYAMQYKKGVDIGKGFESIVDQVTGWFSKTKKSPLKTVHKKQADKKMAGFKKEEFDAFNKQKRIDIILDKISKSGYDSLTKEEKAFLFKAGK